MSSAAAAKRFLIVGGTGLTGSFVGDYLSIVHGCKIDLVTRRPDRVAHKWKYSSILDYERDDWSKVLTKDHVILNVSGFSIGDLPIENIKRLFSLPRWNRPPVRDIVLNSRLDSIRKIEASITKAAAAGNAPQLFLQSSACGIFGDCADELLYETKVPTPVAYTDIKKVPDSKYLIACSFEIEKAAHDAIKQSPSTKVKVLRFGHVIDTKGGILTRLELASLFNVKCLGTGRQYYPWIHVEDIARIVHFASTVLINDNDTVIHTATPNSITNADMLEIISKRNRNFLNSRLPKFPFGNIPLRLAMGSVLGAATGTSQRLMPGKLLDSGYEFRYPKFEQAMESLPYKGLVTLNL